MIKQTMKGPFSGGNVWPLIFLFLASSATIIIIPLSHTVMLLCMKKVIDIHLFINTLPSSIVH